MYRSSPMTMRDVETDPVASSGDGRCDCNSFAQIFVRFRANRSSIAGNL